MEKEAILGNFIKSVIMLSKTTHYIEDEFFFEKFEQFIFRFSRDFINYLLEERNDNVAQYTMTRLLLSDIDSILDIYKEIEYLNLIKPSPLLLKTQTELLALKLEILRRIKRNQIKSKTPEVAANSDAPTVSELPPVLKKKKEEDKLAESKQKLVDYIKSFPNSRTKDIIYEFNALSARSVKRNLTDLIKAGLVKKKVISKAAYYYITEVQP